MRWRSLGERERAGGNKQDAGASKLHQQPRLKYLSVLKSLSKNICRRFKRING